MRITIDTDAKTFILHGEVKLKELIKFIQQNFPNEIMDNWTIINEKELDKAVEKISAPLPAQDGNPIIPWDKPFEWPKNPYPTQPYQPWPWIYPNSPTSPYTPKNPWPITPIYCTLSNDPKWTQFATKS